MKLYNTLTKNIEELAKTDPFRMFVCGPTVYDYIHMGNARTFVFFDILAKYLRFRGYKVNFIQNITDIDDKIINKALELHVSVKELTDTYTKNFLEDMNSVGVTAIDSYPRATDYIPQIVEQVQALIAKGHVYAIPHDGYYFDLSSFPDYGKLSRRTMQMADDGVSRIDDSDAKRNRGDFCVWKFSKENEPSWDTDLGKGRPGWHIEDTAITQHFFGPQYELHGGGQDLMFPHHEAEIAQQESASGLVPFVQYWVHSGFVLNKSRKMSKSLGNFSTLHDLLAQYTPQALRLYFVSAHYRSELDFNDEVIDSAVSGVDRIRELYHKLTRISPTHTKNKVTENLITKFTSILDNDMQIPEALGFLFDIVKDTNNKIDKDILSDEESQGILAFLDVADTIFGIVRKPQAIPQEIQDLVTQRNQARNAKDFSASDTLRAQIESKGYVIEDSPDGTIVQKK